MLLSPADYSTPLLPGLEDGEIVMIDPSDRNVYSTKGVRLRRPRIGVRLRYHIDGEVVLTDGRLAGGDLLCDGYTSIFAQRVPPGRYPVVTVIAETATDSVVAFGAIRFTNATAEKCRLALYEGESTTDDIDDLCGGLGTDSGTIALGAPDERQGSPTPSDQVIENHRQRVYEELGRNNRCAVVAGVHDATICIWRSGFGDGLYTPYWGTGRNGELCFLAAEFAVVANGLRAPAVKWRTIGKSLDLEPMNWWQRLSDRLRRLLG